MRKNKALLNLFVSALTIAMTICSSFSSFAEEATIVPEEIILTEEATSEEELILPEGIVTEVESEEVAEEQVSISVTEIVTEEEITEESETETFEVQFLNQESETSVTDPEPEELEIETEEIISEEEITVPEPTVEETPEVLAEEEPVPETTEAYLIDSWAGTEQIKDLKGASSPEGSVLTWSAIPDAEGYLIGAIQNGNPYRQIDFIVGGSNTRYVDKNASLTAYSYYWVFPYKKVNGKIVRGKASSKYVYGIKQLPAPKLKAVPRKDSVYLAWNAIEGADGYIIKYRRGKNGEVKILYEEKDLTITYDPNAPTDEDTFYWVYAYKLSGNSKRAGATSSFAYARKATESVWSINNMDYINTSMAVGEKKEFVVTYRKASEYSFEWNITDDSSNWGKTSSYIDVSWSNAWDNDKRSIYIVAKNPGTTSIHLHSNYNAEGITIDITIEESKLESALKQQPVYVLSTFYTVQDEKYKSLYPDLMQSVFYNNSGKSIRNAVIAFVAWDKNKLPIMITTKWDYKGRYLREVNYEGINLISGEYYGDHSGLEMDNQPTVATYLKSIVVSTEDFNGNVWTNPYYEEWKQTYVGKVLN